MKLNVKSGVIYDNEENLDNINFGKNQIFVHNQINRIDNKSENLYFEEGFVPFGNQEKYFLVQFMDESFINEFEKILKIVQELGLGGNKNIGWGKIKISGDNKDFSFLAKNKTEKFITLSPIIAKNINLKESYYNFYTFVSYTDGSFDNSKLKGKVDYIEEGSIIKKQANNPFAGVLKKINDIYQYGLEFPVYMEW
jgi:CRISPR-associated protein Csm4